MVPSVAALAVLILTFAGPRIAQQPPAPAQSPVSAAANPLAESKDEVQRVLAAAGLPLTGEQEKAIVLMMEDRRQASEDLFGDLMNFQAGPTRGEQEDHLRSAIEWMRGEFLKRLQDYLRPEQLAVWSAHQETTAGQQTLRTLDDRVPARQGQQAQTQYVRINNNAFTAEDGPYRFSRQGSGQPPPQVVDRGGAGAFHGNAQVLLKDESLNARNPFADNKPPYQERQGNFDISGPIIPRKLTTSFAASQNEAQNVDTVHATLPEGLFALGITRPTVQRSFTTRNTYQVSQAHSISLNLGYAMSSSKNQGVGQFALPERAWTSKGSNWNVEVVQFSNLSALSIFESRFKATSSHDETRPFSNALRINVLDTFSSGGAQNRSENTSRDYDFGNLYTRLGEKMTMRAGTQGRYRNNRSFSENDFGGTFTFSNLDSYLAGRPLTYRVTRGNPLLETDQLELSFFSQNDWKVSSQLTLMLGARYDYQTNMRDHNNLAPRLGFAYALSRATVIRGGGGMFYLRMDMENVENQRRLDGTRQFEIVIDNPSYPDPFQAGTIRNTLPSIRVMDPNLEAPYVNVAMISFERTFFTNLLLSATYDYQREYHRLRLRNLNAPLDSTAPFPRSCSPATSAEACVRPDPSHGDAVSLESTSNQLQHTFRLNFRQRFSIFNVSAAYLVQRALPETSPNGDALSSDNYNLRADYVRSHGTCCPTHNVNSTVNARLPLGIFLTGTAALSGPHWYNITTGKDDNRDSVINDRPPGFPRNGGKGPKTLNFNFNISKAFFFGAPPGINGKGSGTRKNLNVFANMTNAFNRTNYGTPSGVMTSPNFGKFTSAQDPRQIEAGMRYQF
ncbi:MAG: hypothetical protein DMG13_12615 [Acidobacteria bacterium]|nr:MAG: hypothetical protein DMG13_12615 [Acidobacteriota bacterium]